VDLRLPSCVPVALCLLAAAGCGGSEEEASRPVPRVPACAGEGQTIPRPRGIPRELPLPPGTELHATERPYPDQVVVRGAVPGELEDAASFFEDELPDAGYRLGRGDAEPNEREALFTGNGVRGGWRVRAIPACEGAVTLTLVVIRLQ
jgi:hypothetical protein